MKSKKSWTKDEILSRLEPYEGMQALFEELDRRFSSPNYTEPAIVGPGVFETTNPRGISMDSHSPDFFGPREMMLFQTLVKVALGEESDFLTRVPEDLEQFDHECSRELERLLSRNRLQ